MNEADAIKMLQRLEFYVQKCRSDMMEGMGCSEGDGSTEMRVLTDLHPWLFGENCILKPLSMVNERVAKGEPLTAMDFYNMMYIVSKTPALELSPTMFGADFSFPKPSPRILTDWEPTSR